ncbi:hypothetical protein G9A89_003080 [Geosiphon pyriformis]|nr:hypothetical protein G9A89_003080 [Geosiphon pyriformis]
MLSVKFLSDTSSPHAPSPALAGMGLQSIFTSPGFVLVHDQLSQVLPSSISVYTDGFLTNLGTKNCMAGAGVFFSDIDLGLGIGVLGLLSFTLAEMQAIALALECVPHSSCVHLFFDSQAALDAYKSELGLVHLDFHNCCWVERLHIINIIHGRNLLVEWHKVKGHSGMVGNKRADAIADASSHSGWFLPFQSHVRFLLADGGAVSGNSRHFVYDIFHSVSHAHWEIGSGSKFLPASLFADVDWSCSLLVWHPDSHMATGHTSKPTADVHSFFMKALHHWLPAAVHKHLYDRKYSSVLCLYCGEVETSDNVFFYKADVFAHLQILDTCSKSWMVLSGLSFSSSCVLRLLSSSVSDVSVFTALSKGFVFIEWLREAISVFKCHKAASSKIVEFVHSLSFAFRNDIWLVRIKHCAFMKKNNLIPLDGSVSISVPGSASRFSAGIVRLLGICFGFRKHCSFFSGVGDSVLYDKSKLFFDYKATVGSVIAVIKKTAKVSGSESGFKAVASRKKRKGGVLAEGVDNGRVVAEVPGVCSWGLETGDTTESESVDMEEECLVEKTSFDYGEGGALAGGDYDQTPTSSKVKTKKALGKPLGKIDFSKNGSDDGVLLDASLELPSSVKNLVNVSVRKSFALDIGLDKVAGKSSQEKLVVVRKLFSGINGFGGASTPSKFSGIIRVTFTSESSLVKATDKAVNAKILVNADLKKASGQSDRAVVMKEIPVGTSSEAVRAALSKFEVIRTIKIQLIGLWQKAVVKFERSDQADLAAAKWSILIRKNAVRVARADSDKKVWDIRDQHRALLYTLLMGTNAHDIWDFVRSVGGKTCIIDRYSVMYAQARCAVVCFDSAELLDAAVGTTPVLRNTNLHWSCLISAKCAKYEKLGHTSLGCAVGGKLSSSSSLCRVFSDMDKSRLATIYVKRSAPVAYPVSFGGLSWAKVARRSFSLPLSSQNVVVTNGSSSEMKLSQPVTMEVNDRFAALERSLASLAEQVGKLAKRLDTLGPMVSQPSPGCQPLVTPSSQDQEADVVISEGLSVSTSGENVVGAVSFDMSSVSKLEDSIKCLMVLPEVFGLFS